jgi:hypothetical protein
LKNAIHDGEACRTVEQATALEIGIVFLKCAIDKSVIAEVAVPKETSARLRCVVRTEGACGQCRSGAKRPYSATTFGIVITECASF